MNVPTTLPNLFGLVLGNSAFYRCQLCFTKDTLFLREPDIFGWDLNVLPAFLGFAF